MSSKSLVMEKGREMKIKLSKKHKLMLQKVKKLSSDGVFPVVLIVGLIIGLAYKRPAQALSNRGKKAVGVLVGAGLMGATAGAAGGGKWVPLGLFGGGLTGGLIARGATKDSDEMSKVYEQRTHLERKLQRTNNPNRRLKIQRKLDEVNMRINRLYPQ